MNNTSNIYDFFRSAIFKIMHELSSESGSNIDIPLDAIIVELVKDIKFGDYSTNVAMTTCKKFGLNPKVLAEKIVSKLSEFDFVKSASVAGPGFVNWCVKDEFIFAFLKRAIAEGVAYGDSQMGNGKRVNVEFVSANPTGPIHAGHARGAVVGDVLASVLQKAGYEVTREYYVNDYGNQVNILAKSIYGRYLELLGLGKFEPKDGEYPGEYLIEVAKKIVGMDGDKWVDEDYVDYFREFAVKYMISWIKDDLNALGVKHDVFTFESGLVKSGAVDNVVKFLEAKGLVYTGVLDKPRGMSVDDWEPREQVLFKSTLFGDDVDRPLIKSDGKWTYFASDIAYHLDKINRGFGELVNVFGADHGGYVVRMKSAVAALDESVLFSILLTQLVKFVENGTEVKMSKRAGTFITARDVVDTVGKDVLRFVMLTRKSEAGLDFDFQKVTEQSAENPVFYVQYASARAHSVLRQFKSMYGEFDPGSVASVDLSSLESEQEKKLTKIVLDFPRQILLAAITREPHRIAFFLQDVAAEFHALWSMGKCNEKLRFVSENDRDASMAKCCLVYAVSVVITSGLKVLGVESVEEL